MVNGTIAMVEVVNEGAAVLKGLRLVGMHDDLGLPADVRDRA